MWESILPAYAERSRVIPPDYRKLVAGVWRPVEGGIEATAFHRLPDEAWAGLAAEARSLAAFLADREPEVYRRYGHWWKEQPNAAARLLPGY